MHRSRDVKRLQAAGELDLLVVGGGAAGAALLRAAALHGLRTALCERHDFAAGTSGRSSRLIHGGLRYLEHGHLRLVAEALSERATLCAIAPHLVEPLAIHLPIYRHNRRGPRRVRLGLWLYDRLARRARLGESGVLDRGAALTRLPGLEPTHLEAAGVLWDARCWWPERLVVEHLVDAERLGAIAVNRTRMLGARQHAGAQLAELEDGDGGARYEVRARVIVNAAGPWVGEVDGELRVEQPARVQWSRGSHLLYRRFAGDPAQALYCEAEDGRPFFVLPWGDHLLVGTTEIPHAADPATARASAAEIDYLRESFAGVWPDSSSQTPYASYAGVRPLPLGRAAARADRRHQVVRHGTRAISLVGGKLTTHRLAAEEMLSAVLQSLGRPAARRAELSAGRQLPGAACDPPALDPSALAARHGLPASEAERLIRRWGCRAWSVAARFGARPALPGLGLLPDEIVFAAHHEGAASLDDVLLRRTDAGLAPDLTVTGLEHAARVWAWAQTEGSRSEAEGTLDTPASAPPWESAAADGIEHAHHVRDLLEESYGRQLE